MARYYESEALIEFVKQNTPHMNGETTMKCVARAIREAPTADVVPKSEVACELVGLYEKCASKIPHHIRRIFKDDRNFEDGFREGKTDALIEVLALIAELKKKYTEGET